MGVRGFIRFLVVLGHIFFVSTSAFAQIESLIETPVLDSEEVPSAVEEEVPIILRGPASVKTSVVDERARVVVIQNSKRLTASSDSADWSIGEVLALESQTEDVGIIAFVSVLGVESNEDGTYQIQVELVRQSRIHMVQTGDLLMHLDLSSENPNYKGTTDLIVKQAGKDISSKYKPLFTQGFAVGETAQTLWKNEYIVNFYGHLQYGIADWLTVGSIIPGNFLGAPNINGKARVYESASNVAATGLSFAKIPNESNSTLNLNLYWDSISSESVISHTLVSIALLSFERAQDTTAIKSLGTSSIQTGNEFILSNWDRVLIGPSYNFEAKAVGGYIAYVKIWDQFHTQIALNTTDIANARLNWTLVQTEGYFFGIDMYWRF